MTFNRRKFISAGLSLTASTALARQVSPLGTRQNYDVAIIGAGLFGSAAARYLSADHDDIVLIGPAEPEDKSQHQGVFASHHDESRLVRGVDPDIHWATLAKNSIGRFRQLEKSSGIDFYNEVGYMMVTPGGLGEEWFDLPAMRQVAKETDVDIMDLDYTDLTMRYPFLHFTPSSTAVLQNRNAGYINPRRLLAAQQKLSIAQGVTLLRDIAVSQKRTGDQIEIETGSGELIYANRVLVATGAYTNASGLLPHKLKTLIRAAMIMETDVSAETPTAYPTTLYAKTDGEEDFWGLLMPPIRYADGRTVIKTMDGYYGPAPLEGFEDLGNWNRGNGHQDHLAAVRRALHEVFPTLNIRSTQFKPCLITDTESHYPYIDMVDDRIGVVAGGNGKSAKSSDEIGRLAAEMIGGKGWPSTIPPQVFQGGFA